MGLLIECPKCKRRNGEKALASAKTKNKVECCLKCGYALGKGSGKVYWIEYRPVKGGEKKRERIGPNKAAAEHRLREVLSARTEERYIQKSPDALIRFKGLAEWYLTLDVVKNKTSYDRDKRSVGKLCGFFGNHLLRDITPALVERYIAKRLAEASYRGHFTKPATVRRELSCMNHIYALALRERKAEGNPVKGTAKPPENNERNRVLSAEEYNRLIAECPHYIAPVVKLAYYTGLRRGEILRLTWDQVDLKEGFINLPAGAKNKPGRPVPLHPELVEMLRAMPHGLRGVPVFNRQGKPITGSTIREGVGIACRRAGIEGFTFHDLRHTFVTNMRRAGVHDFVTMAITGHKTMATFKRYNTVSRSEVMAAVGKIKGDGHLYGHLDILEPGDKASSNG